ncbi:MFS transporter [Musicola paradisiaca]|uniref:Major facilitator superfamily MFS_1 n=1 Tax=Musicola paradisiaca (strain Ech703) TaxID=579405 RepID=C6C530_MUSP7|nr:MFS transporter [Musicola paradisiaca]ACS85640.1 major facilitator superfamily MFS_1 [Musicola paradisiaca Ech703]
MVSTANTSYRWVILAIATLAQACACFFVQGIGTIAIYIQHELHLSAMQIGLLVSAAQLVPLVGLLVAGELLDRYSERLVVGIGTLVVACALMAAMLAGSYSSILMFLIVVGAGYSTAQPGGSKSVARWFDKQQRGFAMGIRQAGLPLGGALAAAILPFTAAQWGWRYSFLVGGLVALVGALVFILFYRSPHMHDVATQTTTGSLWKGAILRLHMLTDPSMKNIMVSGVSLVSAQYGILVFTVLYLHDRLQMEVALAASLLFVGQIAGAIGRILLAAWSDHCKSGRYFPVFVCMIAAVVSLLALIWLPLSSPLPVALLLAWLGFFGFGWYGPWVAYVAESAPPQKTGFALGLSMAVNQVAIVLVTPALGLLRDTTQSDVPGWFLLVTLIVLGLLFTRPQSQIGQR